MFAWFGSLKKRCAVRQQRSEALWRFQKTWKEMLCQVRPEFGRYENFQSREALHDGRREAAYFCQIGDIQGSLSSRRERSPNQNVDLIYVYHSQSALAGKVADPRRVSLEMELNRPTSLGKGFFVVGRSFRSSSISPFKCAFTGSVSSLATPYKLWKAGNLYRGALRDVVGKINLDPPFSRSLKFPDLDLCCAVSSWTPTSSDAVFSGSGIAASGTTEALQRHPFGGSLRRGTRSQTLCTSKTPLIRSESRGINDWPSPSPCCGGPCCWHAS